MTTLWQEFAELKGRINTALDTGRADILDLRKRGQAAIDALTALVGRVTTLETKATQVQARILQDEAAFTALANRVTAAEAELVKLDPTYVPPTS